MAIEVKQKTWTHTHTKEWFRVQTPVQEDPKWLIAGDRGVMGLGDTQRQNIVLDEHYSDPNGCPSGT